MRLSSCRPVTSHSTPAGGSPTSSNRIRRAAQLGNTCPSNNRRITSEKNQTKSFANSYTQSKPDKQRAHSIARSGVNSSFNGSSGKNGYSRASTFCNSRPSSSSGTHQDKQLLDASLLGFHHFDQTCNTSSQFQSLNSTRPCSPQHVFPKAKRFCVPPNECMYKNEINLRTMLTKQSVTIGSGKKTDIFPFKHLEKAAATPAPNSHHLRRYLDDSSENTLPPASMTNQSWIQDGHYKQNIRTRSMSLDGSVQVKKGCGMSPGRTFGVSFEHSEKKYLEYANKMIYSPLFQQNNPGPGRYNVSERIGSTKRKSSIGDKIDIKQMTGASYGPALTKYSPSDKLQASSRYKGISFGYGNKINIAAPLNQYPGPIYQFYSQFDPNYHKRHCC